MCTCKLVTVYNSSGFFHFQKNIKWAPKVAAYLLGE